MPPRLLPPLLPPPLSLLLRSPSLRASLVYLVISPSASVAETLIGSTSEYRFPHPLTTTSLHLLLALLLLLAYLALSPPLYRILRLPRTQPRPPLSFPLPLLVLSTLLSASSALLHLHLTQTTHPVFSTGFAPLLPLFLSAVVENNPVALGVWAVCALGRGISADSDAEGWVTAVVAGAGKAAWVWVLCRLGRRRSGRGAGSSATARLPSLLAAHLSLSLPLFSFLAFSSPEPALIIRHNHWRFFTEAGFWAQETGTAACSLANLAVFFWAATTLPSPSLTLALTTLKHRLLRPLLFHALLGNPLDTVEDVEHGFFGLGAQVAVVGVGAVAWAWVEGRIGREEGEEAQADDVGGDGEARRRKAL
ncbi:hypothetical protein JCM10207_008206 [Rhodosporidiobolus poonsookiae]